MTARSGLVGVRTHSSLVRIVMPCLGLLLTIELTREGSRAGDGLATLSPALAACATFLVLLYRCRWEPAGLLRASLLTSYAIMAPLVVVSTLIVHPESRADLGIRVIIG